MEMNDSQRQVIENLDDDILLLASAGTGKTWSLAKRIEQILLLKKAKQEEILALTFTNKAAKEMKERIEKTVPTEKNIEVRTIHGFCYQILKSEAKENTDIPQTFTIFDEEDTGEVLSFLWPKPVPKNALNKFIALVKETATKEQFFNTNKELDICQTLNFLYQKRQKSVHRVCMENFREVTGLFALLKIKGEELLHNYEQLLIENHALDYTDLITRVFLLFQDAKIAKKWAEKYRFIHIDEVQDTNLIEYELLEKIFTHSKILLAGDYWQTIYEWRGSDPDEVIATYRRKRNPLILHFEENYRSSKTLLAASMGFLKRAFPKKENFLIYETIPKTESQGNLIKVKENFSLQDEAKWIYQEILKLQEKDATFYGKTCILTRTNMAGRDISNALFDLHCHIEEQACRKKTLFPFSLVDEYQFFRRQEIKDVFAYLRLLVSPEDTVSFRRLLKRFGEGVGEKTLAKIEQQEFLACGIKLTDYIDQNALKRGDFYDLLLEAFQTEHIVVFDVESTGVDIEKDEIIQLSAVLLDQEGKVKKTFDHYLKTNRSLTASVGVHHITEAILKEKGEEAEKVFLAFDHFIKDAVLVGHNVLYDLSILASQRQRLHMPPFKYKGYVDTLSIFRRFYPQLPNHKLLKLCEFCKVQNISTHNALDDVKATADILTFAITEKILPTRAKRRAYFLKYIDKFFAIAHFMKELHTLLNSMEHTLTDIIVKIIKEGKIISYYQKEDEKNGNTKHRQNLERLFYYVKDIEGDYLSKREAVKEIIKTGTLSASELDILTKNQQKIPIITVHQAKGMEFDYVFIAHLAHNVFPSYAAIKEGNLDEEKRVFYVAMTRAKKVLYLSYHRARPHSDRYYQKSEFLKLIPSICMEEV